MIEQPFYFNGGIDLDSDPSTIQVGDYLMIREGRVTRMRDGHDGTVRPLPKPRLVTGPSVEGTGYECIGRHSELLTNRVFFFIRSKDNELNDQILVYDGRDDRAYLVVSANLVKDRTLQFDREKPIGGVEVIEGVLYWTGGNQIMSINVEAAIMTSFPPYATQNPERDPQWRYRWFGTGDQHTGLRDLTLIKPNPYLPLIVKPVRSVDLTNYVGTPLTTEEQSYQFSYRYKFRDGERSVMSPISRTIYESGNSVSFDLIQVSVPAPSSPYLFPRLVNQVEFFVREGNIGDWKEFKQIDINDDAALFAAQNNPSTTDSVINLIFDGTYSFTPDQGDLARLFDLVPVKSQTLCQGGEHLLLANNSYGFKTPRSVPFNTSQFTYGLEGFDSYTGHYLMWRKVSNLSNVLFYEYKIYFKIPSGPQAGLYLIAETDPTDDPIPQEFNNVSVFVRWAKYEPFNSRISYLFDSDQIEEYHPSFVVTTEDKFSNPLPLNTYTFPPSGVRVTEFPNKDVTLTVVDESVYDSEIERTSKSLTLKSNSRYTMGICYFDFAGRTSGVIPTNNIITTSPLVRDNDAQKVVRVIWSLPQSQSLLIPEWAYSYSICMTKNLTTRSFIQTDVQKFQGYWNPKEGVYEEEPSVGSPYIGLSIPDYTYSEGDVMYIYDQDLGFETIYDVVGQSDGITNVVSRTGVVLNQFNSEGKLIEIFTPYVSTDEEPYYEHSTHLIINPTQPNRSYSVVSGQIDGDVKLQYGAGNVLESVNLEGPPSAAEWVTNAGRPIGKVRQFEEKNDPTSISWSEPLRQGFSQRGVNTFNLADIEYADISVGPLRKLIEARRGSSESSIVLGIGESDACSIYVGKSVLSSPDGSDSLFSSGKVIGTINLLLGGYGTTNPESVVRTDEGRVYWFDSYGGNFVRYTSEGIRSISQKGMSSFSQTLGELYTSTDEHIMLPSGYDPVSKDVIFVTPASPYNFDAIKKPDEWVESPEVTQVLSSSPLSSSFTGTVVGKKYRVIPFAPITPTQQTLVSVTSSGSPSVGLFQEFIATSNTLTVTFPSPAKPFQVIIQEQEDDTSFIVSSQSQCIAFNDFKNRWTWVSSLKPESIGRIGTKCVLWEGFRIKVWDDYSDTIGPIEITVAAGDERLRRCDFSTLSSDVNSLPTSVNVRILHPESRYTDMVDSDFRYEDGIARCPILRDIFTPSISDVNLARVSGDNMTGAYAYVSFKYEDSPDTEVRNITVKYNPSRGH